MYKFKREIAAIFVAAFFVFGFRAVPGPTIDYAEEVAPILNRSCVGCHQPGQAAPFSLVGYENARKWAPMILQAIETKQMPPWRAEQSQQRFHDENRIEPNELHTLRDWHRAGAPAGDLQSAPLPKLASSEWELGRPDIVLTPSAETPISADGADEYRNYVFKTDFKENRYLTALDFIPGNRKVVHHVVVYVDAQGIAERLEQEDKDGLPGYLTSGGVSPGFIPDDIPYVWAPGIRPRHLPPGIAFKLKPGSSIIVQVHYHKTGKPESDLSRLGLYLSETKPQRTAEVEITFDPTLKVPAGKANVPWEHKWISTKDYELHTIMPHMHYLGRTMSAEVRRPDGSREELITVNHWDFRWQLNYAFLKPVLIPQGSEIVMRATYDNSAANPNNPNRPPKDLYFGPESTDEMFLFVFTLVPTNRTSD